MNQSATILVFLFTLLLSACSPFSPSSNRAGMCNELNSRMIFSGSTANVRKAEMQETDEPLVSHSYDTKCDSLPERKNALFR
jgi:hypothetical protein